jgi:quinol monooxygenase YgiN
MKKSTKLSLMLSIIASLILFSSCCPSSGGDAKQCDAATGEELVIVAHLITTPEHKDDLLKALEEVVKGTRTEAGSISYTLYEDVNNPLKLTIIEFWKSKSAIDEHNATAHFKEFVTKIEGKAALDVSTMKHKF